MQNIKMAAKKAVTILIKPYWHSALYTGHKLK